MDLFATVEAISIKYSSREGLLSGIFNHQPDILFSLYFLELDCYRFCD